MKTHAVAGALSTVVAAVAVVAGGSPVSSPSQDAQVPGRPVFEVVSVKPNPAAHAQGGMGVLPGGRFEAVNATPFLLITFAYDLGPDFVDGAPDWTRTERLDVQGKAANPAVSSTDLRLMVRSLLADRFGLVAREVLEPRPTYGLVRTRSDGRLGPKLRRVAIDCDALDAQVAAGKTALATPPSPTGPVPPCLIRSRLGTVHSGAISMPVLAKVLYQGAERIVVDKTGLTGWYAVELDYRPPFASVDAPEAVGLPSLFAALEEQLGLRLVSELAPVPTLVIERISRPTPD